MNKVSITDLSSIVAAEHLRQRIDPRPGDVCYLHLSDLLLALKAEATDKKLDILDYGAGGSPYRALFPNANYCRADFAIGTGEGLDFVLNESLLVTAPDSSFDLILSTQVIEHVEHPEIYLKECLRLLRPGGKLILTTHGIFSDHPCPLDLHRWTADGLTMLSKNAGFEVVTTNKLTTNARALFFLYDLHGRHTHRRAFSFFSAIFAVYYRFHKIVRPSLHRWADQFFPGSRITENRAGTNDIYINILVHAEKPLG